MTKNKRWIKSVTETAKTAETQAMPWQRGSRRAEMIAQRAEKETAKMRRHA